MIKRVVCIFFLFAAATVASAQTPTPTPAPPRTAPAAPHTSLKVGQAAPDFTLPSTMVGADGRGVRYKLSDFKGKKNVVLAFYVLAFTGG
jgi:AhpC/TSA family protein